MIWKELVQKYGSYSISCGYNSKFCLECDTLVIIKEAI